MNAREERKITASPKEVRDLADKMEERYAKCKLGDTTFVDFMGSEGNLRICLHFDQMYFHELERKQDQRTYKQGFGLSTQTSPAPTGEPTTPKCPLCAGPSRAPIHPIHSKEWMCISCTHFFSVAPEIPCPNCQYRHSMPSAEENSKRDRICPNCSYLFSSAPEVTRAAQAPAPTGEQFTVDAIQAADRRNAAAKKIGDYLIDTTSKGGLRCTDPSDVMCLAYGVYDLLNKSVDITQAPVEFSELAYLSTLKVGDMVIETGQSGMTGVTGVVYLSNTPGHGLCVHWNLPGGDMGTAVTHGTRRIIDVVNSYAKQESAPTLNLAYYQEGRDNFIVSYVDLSDNELEAYHLTIQYVINNENPSRPSKVGDTFDVSVSKTIPGASSYAGWHLDKFLPVAGEPAPPATGSKS
jgi:hypothetical protein